MSAATEERTGKEGLKSQPFCDVTVFLPSDFILDSGESLSRPELKVRVYGDLEKPAIAVAGGISAGRVVATCKDGEGWWRDMVSPGGFIDLDRYCVIGFDFLPNAGEAAKTVTTRDHARALADALDTLNIEKLHGFVGASYGGMIGLVFAELFPDRIEKLCAISAPDRPHPSATALRGVQRRIIDFALKHGDGEGGVALARQIGMITYRTPEEFGARFESAPGAAAGDPYDICDYLIARGDAYGMDARRYVTLSDSIDRHRADPAKISADSLIIAAETDRLAPLADLERLAGAVDGARLIKVPSLYGHDAFLKETAVIGPHIKEFLEEKTS
ncbi:homoserine O-succinyltransferase MetX [Hyphococcus luteus]|uniref:Alpha/beta hydrolase n=1 Tax=Hyphococcus luteus TaxID=2058213 RepID=A0A2S7JZ75_9PROT|nr:homoserine O-succinyltransferase [Marinicaulis flavus]PQA85559.1 alpha/beta hydrolase [Marinicaulis flavus]